MIRALTLTALIANEQVELAPGDILRVTCSFKYTIGAITTVTLWAALGTGLIRSRMETYKSISLDAAPTPRTWEGDIDIIIPMTGEDNKDYWLRVEIQGYEDETRVQTPDNPILIRGMPEEVGIFDMMGPLLVLGLMMGLMTMMTPMMKEGFE